MPLDCNLFKDWNNRVNYYVFLTFYLPDDNSKKFSLSTPKRLSSAMVRVWEGISASKRIIQDINELYAKTSLQSLIIMILLYLVWKIVKEIAML